MTNPLRMLAAAVRNIYGGLMEQQGGIPTRRENWLGPRFEPINITSNATVQDVQTAIRQAENGDTTPLFRFYRDSLLGDDHIQGEVNKRKLAVVGQVTAVLPEDKTSEDDIAAAAACLKAIRDCENWTQGLSALMSGAQWPLAICENVFRATGPDDQAVRYAAPAAQGEMGKAEIGKLLAEGHRGKRKQIRELPLQYTLKRLEPVNQMLFCFRHAYLVGGVGFGSGSPVQSIGLSRQNAGAPGNGGPASAATTGKVGDPMWWSINMEDWEPFVRIWPIDDQGRIIYDASRASKLDTSRHVVHRGHLLTEHKDNWGGPFRADLFWWLLRGLGRDWFARFMERYGSPFPVGKTNVQDPEAVSLLQQAFSLATKVGGLVIGQDDQVELKEALVQGGADGHAKWHQICNDAISKHITGYGSSDKPAGLNSGEEGVVEGVRSDIRIFDQRMLGETLDKQLWSRFLKFNGLRGQVRTTWGGLSAEDAATFATLLKTVGDAGFEPTDEAIPVVQEKLGIEVQRKAAPELQSGNRESGKAGNGADADDVETMSVNRLGKLVYFSAGGNRKSQISNLKGLAAGHHDHEVDRIAARKAAALGEVYRGAMAPFREIVLRSDSREECLRQLAAAYRDWKPERLASELEAALQVCAAQGAEVNR